MTVDGVVNQSTGTTVVSVGPWMSTQTSRSTQADRLPTASTTRVLKMCFPCVLMLTVVPSGPEPGSSASICHSTWCTPECASVPSTSTLTAPLCQPAEGVTVVSTGK